MRWAIFFALLLLVQCIFNYHVYGPFLFEKFFSKFLFTINNTVFYVFQKFFTMRDDFLREQERIDQIHGLIDRIVVSYKDICHYFLSKYSNSSFTHLVYSWTFSPCSIEYSRPFVPSLCSWSDFLFVCLIRLSRIG